MGAFSKENRDHDTKAIIWYITNEFSYYAHHSIQHIFTNNNNNTL